MNPIDFQPVFDYMGAKFSNLEGKIDGLENKFDNMTTSVDHVLVIVKRLDQERIVTNHRLGCLEANS